MAARLLACLAAVTLMLVPAVLVHAPAASAHPLGDFTVSTHLGLRVEPTAVALDVVLDIAEIPTLRTFPDLAAPSGTVDDDDRAAYRDRTCAALRDAVDVSLDGGAVNLSVVTSSLSFPPGDGGLATARLDCGLRSVAALETVGHTLVVTDSMAVQPAGWREITAVGDGVGLSRSDVPERSVSQVLRSYPEDLRDTPLEQSSATVSVVRGSGVASGGTGLATEAASSPGTGWGVEPLAETFTDLVAVDRLSVGFMVLAVVLSVLLGALHAFAPGHGKALMAAYLVSRNGSVRHAALIAASVTLTHTVGVLLLGLVLSVTAVTAPERVYPWLGLLSGVLLTGIGVGLLRGARRPGGGHSPSHGHHHGHDHGHGHGHAHAEGHRHSDLADSSAHAGGVATLVGRQEHDHRPTTRTPDARGLLAVGFVGGLVPSPSALVVLLGGIALGRAWFGVVLVLAYGVGMALALVGLGLALRLARDRVQSWSAARQTAGRPVHRLLALAGLLPLLLAALVILGGVVLTAQALTRLLA